MGTLARLWIGVDGGSLDGGCSGRGRVVAAGGIRVVETTVQRDWRIVWDHYRRKSSQWERITERYD